MNYMLRSITKGRDDWFALGTIVVLGGQRRYVGGLSRRLDNGDHDLVRTFNVKINDDGCFKVDIGTGSGVKVAFKL